MNFQEIITKFETIIPFEFELLETHYATYSFGSGFNAYRIKGSIVIIQFDGRDFMISIKISSKHAKYPSNEMSLIFDGLKNESINNENMQKISEIINNN
jgi:hypothetical protein